MMRTSPSGSAITKRALDLILSVVALVVLAPVIVLVAGLVRLKLGSPVLFAQLRPGRDGVPFKLMKFRTMMDERGQDGVLLPDERRISHFGAWLRSTSLDELPELWNVLRGEMSLVGPRPLLMEYLSLYSPEQRRRHLVRPGLTGWAQVNGRNALTWDQKFAYDVWYVDNMSVLLDMRILALTLVRVVGAKDINQAGSVTAEPFRGTKANQD
jgi:sugar transferase EpsL